MLGRQTLSRPSFADLPARPGLVCVLVRAALSHALHPAALRRDGEVDLDRHRLGWVREFDDVDFSSVTTGRKAAGIHAEGYVRRREATTGAVGRYA